MQDQASGLLECRIEATSPACAANGSYYYAEVLDLAATCELSQATDDGIFISRRTDYTQ